MRPASWTLAVECVAWSALVGTFLAQYVEHHLTAASAILPHVAVVGGAIVALWSLRLLAWLLLPRALAAVTGALLLGLPLVCLATYYVLVLVGQQTWGRVVSWTLIATYAAEWESLSAALQVPSIAMPGIMLVLGGGAWWVAHLLVRRDWLHEVAHRRTRPFSGTLATSGLLLFALTLYQFLAAPPVLSSEPLSLTFFPDQFDGQLQTHGLRGSETERAKARVDRHAYRVGDNVRRRNVVLVVVDALRADRLGVYGYARRTTPFLESMKARGSLQVVERMSASCAESTCGLLTIARSKYVHQLSDNDFSLYEVLRRHGWKVHLMLGGDHTNFYGLRKLYGDVDSYIDGSMVQGYSMNDDRLVIDQLAQLPKWDGTPRLIQLHLMSSHLVGVRSKSHQRFTPASPYIAMVHRGVSPSQRNEASNHYDNGVLQMDAVVERALATLEAKGYLSDALVVLTADHGEMLGEHGVFGHAKTVHEPSLRVPFVMLHYGHDPTRQIDPKRPASQVDIAPTIVSELGMPQPMSWSGEPLQTPNPRDWIFFRQGHYVGLYDVRTPGRILKYVRRLDRVEDAAFDVLADPDEEVDVLAHVESARRRAWQSALLPAVAAYSD